MRATAHENPTTPPVFPDEAEFFKETPYQQEYEKVIAISGLNPAMKTILIEVLKLFKFRDDIEILLAEIEKNLLAAEEILYTIPRPALDSEVEELIINNFHYIQNFRQEMRRLQSQQELLTQTLDQFRKGYEQYQECKGIIISCQQENLCPNARLTTMHDLIIFGAVIIYQHKSRTLESLKSMNNLLQAAQKRIKSAQTDKELDAWHRESREETRKYTLFKQKHIAECRAREATRAAAIEQARLRKEQRKLSYQLCALARFIWNVVYDLMAHLCKVMGPVVSKPEKVSPGLFKSRSNQQLVHSPASAPIAVDDQSGLCF